MQAWKVSKWKHFQPQISAHKYNNCLRAEKHDRSYLHFNVMYTHVCDEKPQQFSTHVGK